MRAGARTPLYMTGAAEPPSARHMQQPQQAQAARPPALPFIHLTPVQSCRLHGWLNPRRTLDWDSICSSRHITPKLCAQHGIPGSTLRTLQPDVQMWVRHKGASLADVPFMLDWPLHPVYDLGANISDLATMHYAPDVLGRLGITYEFLRQIMHMDDDWMRVLHYAPQEWARIGFTREDALAMGRKRVEWVFAEDFDAVVLKVSSVLPCAAHAACSK